MADDIQKIQTLVADVLKLPVERNEFGSFYSDPRAVSGVWFRLLNALEPHVKNSSTYKGVFERLQKDGPNYGNQGTLLGLADAIVEDNS